MSNDEKFQRITDDITELKVILGKQEVNLGNSNRILDRLTDSVEIHIKRTDTLEDFIRLIREETKQDIENEIKPIKAHISFVRGAIYAFGIFGTLLVALKELGILQKLF